MNPETHSITCPVCFAEHDCTAKGAKEKDAAWKKTLIELNRVNYDAANAYMAQCDQLRADLTTARAECETLGVQVKDLSRSLLESIEHARSGWDSHEQAAAQLAAVQSALAAKEAELQVEKKYAVRLEADLGHALCEIQAYDEAVHSITGDEGDDPGSDVIMRYCEAKEAEVAKLTETSNGETRDEILCATILTLRKQLRGADEGKRNLRAQLAQAHKENEEQARLLGMSGSREADLLAQLAQARADSERLQAEFKDTQQKLAEANAKVTQLDTQIAMQPAARSHSGGKDKT